jgi:hypothetical protein
MSTTTSIAKKTAKAIKKHGGGALAKIKEKEAYLIWRSIPALLSLLPESDQRKMGYDVDDPLFKQLIGIKTKAEFCVALKVSTRMPSEWEKDPEFLSTVRQLSLNNHVLRFQKDIDFSFTQKVLKNGDAQRVKLWKQLYEGWTEKTEVKNLNIEASAAELQAFIEQRNKELWRRNDELNIIEDEEEDLQDIADEEDTLSPT